MCKKTWRPQVNKQLRKEARRNIVDATLFSLRKQNSGFCNNYSLRLQMQINKCCGSKKVEDAKIYIVHVQK